ncbi:MAG: tRNA adenosine(34) deaminase TadA [Proteobacteria bacterium]|nr:tRNA adenosine(34) deaminase TadA [Pseudomonadota bacterium]
MGIDQDQHWMRFALEQAMLAEKHQEVPVGAVLVKSGKINCANLNQVITLNKPSAHAEILVLEEAGSILENYRLVDTELYVTLEPCMMCAGAMVHARLKRVIFGAYDFKTGVLETVDQCLNKPYHNHQLPYTGGVLEDECATLLKNFFRGKR